MELNAPTSPPKERVNPLLKFSLRGKADELEANAAACVPLPCGFIRMGQATMIYAPPGTGKTLVSIKVNLDAIHEGVIEADKLFYINADDNSQGLATKVRLLEDYGAHMLAVGHNNLRTSDVAEVLTQAGQNGTAKGSVVVIDTLKKFTNLMDKKSSANFAQICREFVAAGGTIIALGHTAKNNNEDGTPRYQGTTDILEDFDAVYVGMAAKSEVATMKGVIFKRLKSRGASPEQVAYGFSNDNDDTYELKFASVVPMDPDELDFIQETEQGPSDDVIRSIYGYINYNGSIGKMALAKRVAKMCSISQKAALKAIELYCGPDPVKHNWHYRTGEHGKRHYFLHRPDEV